MSGDLFDKYHQWFALPTPAHPLHWRMSPISQINLFPIMQYDQFKTCVFTLHIINVGCKHGIFKKIAVETKYVIIATVRYWVLQILMVVVTWKSRQRLKRRTPFLVISYQSSPSPSHRQTESNLSNYPRVRTSSYFQWVLILKIPSLNSLFKLWLFLKVLFLHTQCLSYFYIGTNFGSNCTDV